MKVALYTDSSSWAGTEQHMLDLGTALRELGLQVFFACPRQSPLAARVASLQFPVIAVEKCGLIDWRAAWSLWTALRRERIQIIHAHNGRTQVAAAMAVALAGRGRLVATQHFIEPNRLARRWPLSLVAGLVHALAAFFTAHTVAISEAVANSLRRHRLAPPDRITVVPNGIADITAQPPVSERPVHLVVCAARLEPEKDVATLIAAMAGARRPGLECWVAGSGKQQRSLEADIIRYGVTNSVRLLGYRTDVHSLVAACDIMVLPSPCEPFGLVLLEAMALGRAVVAVGAGGPLEIVVHGETGLLVPPANHNAMGEAIVTLLEDPALRRRMGLAGRRRFEQHFTRRRMAEAIHEVYRRALQ